MKEVKRRTKSGGVGPDCPPGEVMRQEGNEKQRDEDGFEKWECVSQYQKQDKVKHYNPFLCISISFI